MFNLLEQIGDLDRYPTLADVLAHTRALTGRRGFHVETIGQSRMGRDIELVSFGRGDKPVILLWGFEDPHEPVCAWSMRGLWGPL